METKQLQHSTQKVTEALIESLFKKYFAGLCVFARQYVFDNDKVKDIVHDVFINIWEKGELYENDALIKGYLFTSVKNRCFNFIRDNKKFNKNGDEAFNYEGALHDTNVTEFRELENLIKKEIENLPEKCREVFILSRYEELKYAEIAERLDISVKTVEAHMSKALKLLRDNLSPYIEMIVFLILYNFINKKF
ncbi:MAG: ECF RNA polymerase sigma-E factor [Bacteroidetes bacterium ADurb.Bin408]|nr:MAG: ECF RNA polymerase sigma-E factor [Bacteroidetes bacterium ADurb.Bin408]